mmetsp:Transcript_98528/g.234627  ORF Transcript_98528/g.234627 Transcript_98528/m.234627 type:complete len:242 (-) Transcript_98528:597-1322(-)
MAWLSVVKASQPAFAGSPLRVSKGQAGSEVQRAQLRPTPQICSMSWAPSRALFFMFFSLFSFSMVWSILRFCIASILSLFCCFWYRITSSETQSRYSCRELEFAPQASQSRLGRRSQSFARVKPSIFSTSNSSTSQFSGESDSFPPVSAVVTALSARSLTRVALGSSVSSRTSRASLPSSPASWTPFTSFCTAKVCSRSLSSVLRSSFLSPRLFANLAMLSASSPTCCPGSVELLMFWPSS